MRPGSWVSCGETLAITRLVLADAASYDQILGHEGAASREYFRAWRQLIGDTWGFTARERRPPPDPVNAMLSFGYTLLVQEAVAALESAGLDSAVGFLHRGRWGRPCLALDLMEEFRPVTVDTVVLRCAMTGIVRPDEFITAPDLGCRMSPRARQGSWPRTSGVCSPCSPMSLLAGGCPAGSVSACRPGRWPGPWWNPSGCTGR